MNYGETTLSGKTDSTQSTYTRYSELSNAQGQKAEWWLPGAGGGGEGWAVKRYTVSFRGW